MLIQGGRSDGGHLYTTPFTLGASNLSMEHSNSSSRGLAAATAAAAVWVEGGSEGVEGGLGLGAAHVGLAQGRARGVGAQMTRGDGEQQRVEVGQGLGGVRKGLELGLDGGADGCVTSRDTGWVTWAGELTPADAAGRGRGSGPRRCWWRRGSEGGSPLESEEFWAQNECRRFDAVWCGEIRSIDPRTDCDQASMAKTPATAQSGRQSTQDASARGSHGPCLEARGSTAASGSQGCRLPSDLAFT